MPSARKFYRTVFTVTVLSEEPIGDVSLETLGEMIDSGPCSGNFERQASVPVDAPTMATMLQQQGSDPSFFQLDDAGNDLDEE